MKKRKLTDFRFSVFANENETINHGVTGETVHIPHTRNVEKDAEEYFGAAWYSTEFEISEPAFKTALLFHAVYHDCAVYLNGKKYNFAGWVYFSLNDYRTNRERAS